MNAVAISHWSQPAGSVGALTGEQRVAFHVGQRILHGHLVGPFDGGGGRLVGDRPKRADALDGGEGQVETCDRVRAGARVLGDCGRQLTGVGRCAAELLSEDLSGDLRADPGPVLQAAGGVGGQPPFDVDDRHSLRDPTTELRDIGVHLVRRSQPGRALLGGDIHAGCGRRSAQLLSQGMAP